MDITKIDKNFANTFSYEGMKVYDVNEAPFRLYGLCRAEGETDYKRLPKEFAEKLGNPSVAVMYNRTTGIRVRFKTDSNRIILKCVQKEQVNIPHIAVTCSSCFDLYADGEYCNVFRPGIDTEGKYSEDKSMDGGYQSGYVFKGERKMRQLLIHFPLYNSVDQVYIALEEDAQVLPPEEYGHSGPVVFYGSSITQGACASHPGNCYVNSLSRRLDFDFVNLGFSGGCFGEPEFAQYIPELKPSVLVMDYDHNSSRAQLKERHEPFFKEFRKHCPNVPVVFITMADLSSGVEGRKVRRDTICKTYENAVSAGDKNVYFIDGGEIYREPGVGACTVDNAHPNDLGFWFMANRIEKTLAEIL